jgi:hypothetical protein
MFQGTGSTMKKFCGGRQRGSRWSSSASYAGKSLRHWQQTCITDLPPANGQNASIHMITFPHHTQLRSLMHAVWSSHLWCVDGWMHKNTSSYIQLTRSRFTHPDRLVNRKRPGLIRPWEGWFGKCCVQLHVTNCMWFIHSVRKQFVGALMWISSNKNAVFWEVAPCRSSVNRRFGGTYRLHLQGRKIRERETSVSRWLQTELN